MPTTEPRSRWANRKLRGQAYPSLVTMPDWQLTV
jgi:hypothetical protein